MTLKWLKEEEGTVGQFSFRIPSAPLYPGQTPPVPFVREAPYRVFLLVNNQRVAAGSVFRDQIYRAIGYLNSVGQTPPVPPGRTRPGITIGRDESPWNLFWNGNAPPSAIDEVLRILGLPHLASVRSRGGFATLFGTEGNLGQPVTTVGIIGGHIYRARWLVTNPIPLLGCDALPLGSIIQNILNIPGTGPTFPADLLVLTIPSADWEADRRDVPGRAANECVVYAQMRAISDQLLPIGSMQQALQPVGGRLIDFWDATFGITLIDNRTSDSPAPTPPPSIPPVISPPPGPTPPEPPPPTGPPTTPTAPRPPVTTKPKKTASEVVIPWGIGIALVSLAIKLLRK
jgi:hypothetical protein